LCPTRIREYIMKEYICPICQETFLEGSVPEKCPKCGCDKDVFNVIDGEMSGEELAENISESLESSNNYGAEHTVNGLAEIIFWIGAILGVTGFIAGIACLVNDGGGVLAAFLISIGLSCFLLTLIAWAFLRLLVNISYRTTRIDNKLNPVKHDDSRDSKRKA